VGSIFDVIDGGYSSLFLCFVFHAPGQREQPKRFTEQRVWAGSLSSRVMKATTGRAMRWEVGSEVLDGLKRQVSKLSGPPPREALTERFRQRLTLGRRFLPGWSQS